MSRHLVVVVAADADECGQDEKNFFGRNFNLGRVSFDVAKKERNSETEKECKKEKRKSM